MHCRAQAVQLRRDQQQFARAGMRVVLIGLGDPTKAREFRDTFALPFTILADPEKTAFRAYDLIYRMRLRQEALNPDSVLKTLARTPRYGWAMTEQDIFQLGGVFVVDRTGIIRFAYRSLRAADHPPHAAIIASIGNV